jgi:hypothetical protein
MGICFFIARLKNPWTHRYILSYRLPNTLLHHERPRSASKLQDAADRPIRWKDVVDCGKGHDVVAFEKGLDTVRRCEEKILIPWE